MSRITKNTFFQKSVPTKCPTPGVIHFESSKEPELRPPSVREFANVTISPEGVLFAKRRIMPESFSEIRNYENWKKRSIVQSYLQNFLLRRNSIRKEAVWVTDDWSVGYFHWLCDVLPKLTVAKDHLDSMLLLLPASLERLDFVEASLGVFGVSNVEYIKANETVRVEKLFLPTYTARSGEFDIEIINEVRDTLRAAYPSHSHVKKRIYISRRNAGRRKVRNEDDILDVLAEYDFDIVLAERLSFEEQVRLFSSASHLISIHGAGLSNLLFMPHKGSVLELRQSREGLPDCFSKLSSAVKVKYYCHYCDGADSGESPHFGDVIIDVVEFRNSLQNFIEN